LDELLMALQDFPHSSPDQMQQDTAAAAKAAQAGGTSPDVKYSKDEVNYRPAGSSNTRCERCAHFSYSPGARGTGTCEIVAGMIQAKYVCDKFTSSGGSLTDLIENKPTH
jgi:hypothetical protein